MYILVSSRCCQLRLNGVVVVVVVVKPGGPCHAHAPGVQSECRIKIRYGSFKRIVTLYCTFRLKLRRLAM